MRVRSPHSPHTTMTLLAWMGASRSAMPPLMLRWGLGRVCFLVKPTPCTMMRFFSGMTLRILPCLPASRPAMTWTTSFLRSRMRTRGGEAAWAAMALEDLRGQGDDLHELLVAQLAGHRAEHARAHRLPGVVDEHGRVAVEPDVGPVPPPVFLGAAHDDGLHHL